MTNNLIQMFLLFFSLGAGLTILSVHYYLKLKLGKRHDKGYIYMAFAFFSWVPMAIGELAIENGELRDALRIICSALNNAFLVMSFSFIDHGWSKISSKVKEWGWQRIAFAIFIITSVFNALDGDKNHLSAWTDAFLSTVVLTLLFMGLARTFSQSHRNMPVIIWLSYLSGLLFVFTQIYVLAISLPIKGEIIYHLDWPWLQDNKIIGELSRLLTRPFLLSCILCLALTWLAIGDRGQEVVNNYSEGEEVTSFKKRYGVSDEDLGILRRLAEGESMADIAETIPRYSGRERGGDRLQREVIRRLANRFQLSSEKYVLVVLFAIQKKGLDINRLNIM